MIASMRRNELTKTLFVRLENKCVSPGDFATNPKTCIVYAGCPRYAFAVAVTATMGTDDADGSMARSRVGCDSPIRSG